MSELLPKDIAAWHRSEAKKHQELAVFHKKTADMIEYGTNDSDSAVQRYRKIHLAPSEGSSKTDLTLEQFEKAMEEKGGRVNHMAARLRASEDTIWNLLSDPKCKFAVGERGFIYTKDEIKEAARQKMLKDEAKLREAN